MYLFNLAFIFYEGMDSVATIIKAVGICTANRDTVHVEVPFTGGLDVWVKMNRDPEMTWRFVQFSKSRVLNYNGLLNAICISISYVLYAGRC